MAVFEITDAAGSGLTVIVTEFEFEQPFEFVSVTVQVAVEAGDTDGFETVELKPETVLVHEQVLPDTAAAPIVNAGTPAQMVDGDPAEATGNGLTVIVTELDFVHPFILVSVTVYDAVPAGETDGFETVEL